MLTGFFDASDWALVAEFVGSAEFLAFRVLDVLNLLADAFVFPSLYEGFSVPILEALTAQTLVVASDIPPHREVGSDCILYGDPYNVDQYTGILYDGLVGAVRPACTTDASRQFSWVRSAQVLRTVYEQIAARNRADA